MVRIRLRRVGAKKQPSYRIVVADQRSPRDGRFIETIGHYNPRTEPETVNYDEERALHWLSVGAQPTEAVHRLFNNLGTYGRLERMRGGETVDALVEEALAEAEKRTPVNPKTRHEPGVPSKKKSSKAEAESEVETVAEAEDAPAEAEAEAEEAVAEATEDDAAEAEAVEEEASEAEDDADASDEEESEAEEPEASAEAEDDESDDEEPEATDDEDSE